MKHDWRTTRCVHCGGYGVVSVYSMEDFEGPGECPGCGGNGYLFIRPSGHLFQYPGGPARGRGLPSEYQRGTPYREPQAEVVHEEA